MGFNSAFNGLKSSLGLHYVLCVKLDGFQSRALLCYGFEADADENSWEVSWKVV